MRTTLDYAIINADHAEDSFSEKRYRAMVSILPKTCDAILDVGCARGFGGRIVKSFFPAAELMGVDCCPQKIAQLPIPPYSSGIVTDRLSSLLPRKFDGIVAGEMIEHLREEDVDSFLAACFQLLNPGGRLVITTPNPSYLWFRLRGKKVTDIETHQSEHTPETLARRLRTAGFHRIETKATGRVSLIVGPRYWRLAPSIYGSFMIWANREEARA